MRPGSKLNLLGAGVLLLFGLILFSPQVRTLFTTAPRATDAVETVEAVESQEGRDPNQSEQAVLRPAQPDNAHTKAQDDANRKEEAMAARIAELRELARKTDRASLETLLSEVKNPDQEIREAVLDIISQSGNRDFIPDLLEAAAQTNDPDLKKAIAEVVEFLKLPTLTEVLRQTNR